jgi:GNAT superfamily N-acetyltransferase
MFKLISMRNAPDYVVRNAEVADLPAILELEQRWPEALRATEHQLAHRLESFPEGFVLAHVDGVRNKLAGVLSCQRIDIPGVADKPELLMQSWDDMTELGDCPNSGPEGNVVDAVGMIVHPNSRGLGLSTRMLKYALRAIASLEGIEAVTSNIRIPGYFEWHKWKKSCGDKNLSVERYLAECGDPVLGAHESAGAEIQGVALGQLSDIASMGMGVRVSYTKKLAQLQRSPR